MFKNLVFILALLMIVIASPFISVPSAWKNPLLIVLAATVAVVSYREKHGKRRSLGGAKRPKKPMHTTQPTDVPEEVFEVPPTLEQGQESHS
jgi:hypothetical protein